MTVGSSRKQSTIVHFTASPKLANKNPAVWHSVAKLCLSFYGYFIVKDQYHVNCASIFIDTFATSLSNYNQRFMFNPCTAMLRFLSWRHIWWDVLTWREITTLAILQWCFDFVLMFPLLRTKCKDLLPQVAAGSFLRALRWPQFIFWTAVCWEICIYVICGTLLLPS